ncbi:uncharacterized protein LOC109830804 [Asparagus officinalis]|uniref:uncharacterized protein LOC109830804 n=1 Tax=Asparagus officinalis TaxID=4686 RepID=UPI00098E60C7|nr:uncharacterized protein LOC109830804 [Asparagus officinalis]
MEEETQPPGLIPPLDPVAADGAAGYQYDVDPDYVQVDPRSSRALAMFVLFNMVVISVIGYLVKKPYFPEIYVSGFDVSSISLSPNASSPADVFTVNLAFRNPNRVTGIKYYNLRAFLYYGERLITEASLSPFRQRLGGDVTHLKARLPERAAAGGYGAVDEATRFGVRVFLSINYTSVRFRSEPRFDLKTYCRDTGVSLNYTMPCSVRFINQKQSLLSLFSLLQFGLKKSASFLFGCYSVYSFSNSVSDLIQADPILKANKWYQSGVCLSTNQDLKR